MKPDKRCSFCGKHYETVFVLIVGTASSICSECVELCNKAIEWHRFKQENSHRCTYMYWN